jgi:hypothetical protein
MGIIISYCIGVLCILFPTAMSKIIAETLAIIQTPRFGRPPEEQIKVRPIFSILIGVLILLLTTAIKYKS